MNTMGETVTDEEIYNILHHQGLEHDGQISFQDFKKFLNKHEDSKK